MRVAVAVACGAVLVVGAVVPATGSAAAAHPAAMHRAAMHPAAVHGRSGGASKAKHGAGDIDGDGRSDLVIGNGAGIEVVYTSATPDDATNFQDITTPNGPEFGAVAVGDFNGDGLADVAVGAETAGQHGAVYVYYGNKAGIDPSAEVTIRGPHSAGPGWGNLVVPLDLNHDGTSDLLVGQGVIGSHLSQLRGGSKGLANKGKILKIKNTDIGGIAEGDVNGDGHPDLVVGQPTSGQEKEDGEGIDLGNEGVISIFDGTKHGFASKPSQQIHGLAVGTGYGDLGSSLAIAKVNGDKYADIVAGAPNRNLGHQAEVGAVAVLYGGKDGINPKNRTVVTTASKGVPGSARAGDDLGVAVVTADVNGDGYADVVAGADQAETSRNGEVLVFRGGKQDLTTKHAQLLPFKVLGGKAGKGILSYGFGSELAVAHPASLKYASVAIGAPFYSTAKHDEEGLVDVLPGSKSGLTKHGAIRLLPPVPAEDFFGLALGA